MSLPRPGVIKQPKPNLLSGVNNQDDSKSFFEFLFMKHVNNYHYSIPPLISILSAYLCEGPDQNSVFIVKNIVHEDIMITGKMCKHAKYLSMMEVCTVVSVIVSYKIPL